MSPRSRSSRVLLVFVVSLAVVLALLPEGRALATSCVVDGDCSPTEWCIESSHVCTPRLANGVAMPTDPAHMIVTLKGTCTTAAAAIVCLSGVCDTDNA